MESSESHNRLNGEKESRHQSASNDWLTRVREKYGFKVSFLDNQSVHIIDGAGTELAFEFPMENVSFDQYDRFIAKLQDKSAPLPQEGEIAMAIHKPVSDTSRPPTGTTQNSNTSASSWEEHARDHHISVEELQAMYYFARHTLYTRFRTRLRDEND